MPPPPPSPPPAPQKVSRAGAKKVQKKSQITYSAVIFGINTKVGKAYAYYLARKNFNLILIERNIGPMNELEADLKINGLTPMITKIVLDKFD